MPRPTDNLKSEVIKVRVSAEQAERLKQSGNVSEAVRKLIEGNVPQKQKEEKVSLDDYVPRKEYERVLKELEGNNNVPQNYVEKSNSYCEIENMCIFFGISAEELLSGIVKNLQSGAIVYEDGEVKVHGEIDYSRFEEACHERNVPIEKAIEKCTQMILRS